MKTSKYFCLLGVCSSLLFIAIFLFTSAPAAAEPSLEAGASRIEITPPSGTPLAGFGKRRGKPSTGIHDPLYARALSLRKGSETFVFVSSDLVLIDEKLRKTVLDKIKDTGIPSSHIILSATHTHSGAGALGGRFWEKFIMGKFQENVFDRITSGIADAIRKSIQNIQPVQAEYGEIEISEMIENRMDKKTLVPHLLKTFRLKDAGGQIMAFMIFMAAHPTMLPASNMEFSADYPGVLTSEIEKQFPAAAALFINGASGDLRPKPIENSPDRLESMKNYGQALAKKILGISFEPVSLEGLWKGELHRVKLPKAKVRYGWLHAPSLLGGRFFPVKINFQAVRLGSFLFLAYPAEVASEVGWTIEHQARVMGLEPFVIGFANDYAGYVIPKRFYEHGGHYESEASFYGKDFDFFFYRQTDKLLDAVMNPDEKQNANPPGELFYHEKLPVLKLKGSAYHTGYEEGRLLKNEIQSALKRVFDYFDSKLPIPFVNRLIIHRMLDKGWKDLEPFASYQEYEQMRGLAEGAGVSLKSIKRLHALPEVYPTWCANGAYWGKATRDGRLIALRNLDWNREMGIQHFAAIKYFDQVAGPDYINIGYYGFTGVLSGINEKGISVGQIGATSADESMEGVPMPFLLKRVLEQSESVEDAVALFRGNTLTRGYNYVIADAFHKNAVAIETTHSRVAVFYDNDPKEAKVAYAKRLENAVFRGDPALSPAIRNLQYASKGNPKKPGLETPAGSAYEIRYLKQAQLAEQSYGQITPEKMMAIAKEIAPKSNIQSVVYAYPDLWVANGDENTPAAQSKYAHFNFDEIKSRD